MPAKPRLVIKASKSSLSTRFFEVEKPFLAGRVSKSHCTASSRYRSDLDSFLDTILHEDGVVFAVEASGRRLSVTLVDNDDWTAFKPKVIDMMSMYLKWSRGPEIIDRTPEALAAQHHADRETALSRNQPVRPPASRRRDHHNGPYRTPVPVRATRPKLLLRSNRNGS
ncbi:MAG: hypothetical protein JWN38_7 [Candidatus Saccharibacteria bacterium]|nr:hypothetical protein [Candidatus Saccharibacteria bacterium]